MRNWEAEFVFPKYCQEGYIPVWAKVFLVDFIYRQFFRLILSLTLTAIDCNFTLKFSYRNRFRWFLSDSSMFRPGDICSLETQHFPQQMNCFKQPCHLRTLNYVRYAHGVQWGRKILGYSPEYANHKRRKVELLLLLLLLLRTSDLSCQVLTALDACLLRPHDVLISSYCNV